MDEVSKDDSSQQLRVVMLVANQFVHDTRVYKQARSLIEWGVEVHIIALRGKGLPNEEVVDGIFVHRLSVAAPQLRVLATLPISLLLPFSWVLRGLLGFRDGPIPLSCDVGPVSSPTAAASRAADGHDGRDLSEFEPANAASPAGLSPAANGPPDPAPRNESLLIRRVKRKAKRTFHATVGRCVRIIRWRVIAPILRQFRTAVRRIVKWIRSANARVRATMTPNATRLVRLNRSMLQRALALKPDVIECHDLNTLLAGFYAKKIAGVPLIYDSHELYLERNIGLANRRKDQLLWGFIERRCIGTCDAVLSVAQSICLHLEKQYGIPRPHLIRNVQPFEHPCERSRLLSAELGIDPSLRVVIYPGAVTINRGMEVLIDSAVHLDRAVVVIMGYARSAEYLATLRRRAEALGVLGSRVFFKDAVPMNSVIRYVRSADLGVVPTQNVCLSYYYESSNKIFHCLMAGVPVAMSDHPEKRMVAEEFGVGVLFDETDPLAIASSINAILADRPRYEAMEQACLVAARRLNWEHEENRLRSIFSQLLGDRAPAIPPVRLPDHPSIVTSM